MSEGKIAHISKNNDVPTVAFINSTDDGGESEHSTTE